MSSPLTRALETADLALSDGGNTPVLVTSLHTETGSSPCQQGRSLGALKERFPSFDISDVGGHGQWGSPENISSGGYRHPLPAGKRIALFREWLVGLSFDHVVVVGHSGFFKRLLGVNMKNCELVEREL